MSSTISTHQHHQMPLLASLSVVGVIAAAGVVGVVWHESTTSGTPAQAPALTQSRPADNQNARVAERGLEQNRQYGQYEHYYSGQRIGRGFR
jgi:hypothetical protein